MAFQITLSTAATKTAYQRFGDAYIAALSQAVPGLNMEQCQAILSDVIGTVGRKAPKEKKASKAKKSPKSASPSKRDLKKVELIGELKSYGAFAGEIPAVADVSITDIRKQIAEAKKAKKADEKAKKAAKSPKKAKKSPKKAVPSKRDLKKAELAAEIAAKGGSLEKDATEYKIPELRQMLKALTPKKAKKAAAPKKVTPSKRDAKKVELAKEITAKGGSLEKNATEYSITELRNILKSVTPKKKKGRKAKKAAAAEADHESLLATLADSLKAAESKEETKVATKPKVTTQWLDGECTIASVTQFTGGANGEVVATTLHTAETVSTDTAEVNDADKIEFDSSDEEEEEELDEESELSDASSEESDDEALLSDSDEE